MKKIISAILTAVMLTAFFALPAGAATENKAMTVNVKSNLFPDTTAKYIKGTKEITLTYYLSCEDKLINAEARLYFDKSIFAISDKCKSTRDEYSHRLVPVIPNMPNAISNYNPAYADQTKGGFSFNVSDLGLMDFREKKVFLTITLDIIADELPKETEIEFEVATICANRIDVESVTTSTFDPAYIVDRKEIQPTDLRYTVETELTPTNAIFPLGDINYDYLANVNDVTLLQRFLAGSKSLTENQQKISDVNKDKKVDINDVTYMQRIIADAV